MNHVWVVGSINEDLVVRCETLPRPGETVIGLGITRGLGGKGANQAVAAARLGVPTHLVGAVGADEVGERLRALLVDEGIEVGGIATVAEPTGTAVIHVDAAGENAIVVVSGANATVQPPSTGVVAVRPGDVLVVQGEVPWPATRAALEQCRSVGATAVWNPAPASVEILGDLGLADLLVVNEIELATLSGTGDIDDGLVQLIAAGATQVVATLGSEGVRGIVEGGRVVRLEALAVEVVDTTGAGDCFVGVLAARLATGDPVGVALRWAVAAASIAVGREGAAPSMPRAAEVASAVVSG